MIGPVGRRTFRARLAIAIVYLVLALGAVTTVYPFLLMGSTGLKGPTDQSDNHIIPTYFREISSRKADGSLDETSLLGKYLSDKYAGDINAIASTRIGGGGDAALIDRYRQFLMSLPLDYWQAGFRTGPSQVTSRLVMRYQAWLQQKYKRVEEVNAAYNEINGAFETVVPPVELLEKREWKPTMDRKYTEFLEFKATLPAEFRLPVRTTKLFQDFVRSKVKNQFAEVPPEVAGNAKTFEQIQMEGSGVWWEEFKKTKLPAHLTRSTEELWRLDQFGPSIAGVAPAGAEMPIQAMEEAEVASHVAELRSEFASRNYRYVLGYISLNGNMLLNTMIFAGLAILAQLTINPLAAYALSRYPLKSTGRILLFLLATMAFPAEVSMIPGFLLLKGLGLLNTFAALVLPTAASGYMIFLLKGFFDSLPQELFEASKLDGAGDLRTMMRIALPLSRPVLGYLALLAFMGAYGAFLYAFLVAQDRRMWTLMVWIYQLQGVAPKAVLMAALTIAAVPTLLVFLLAQRVIMRGVIIPGER